MSRLPYSPRPAGEEDIPKVAGIEAASIRPPWSEQAFREELGKAHSYFWVITDNETDEVVMAYAVFSFPAEQAHLQTIAVHPEYRRKGIAAYLLRQILAYVMRKKGDSLILELRKGNQAALALYQSLGFVVIRSLPKYYPDGEDGYVMIYRTERGKLSGDPDVDFDSDETGEILSDPESADGKKNTH